MKFFEPNEKRNTIAAYVLIVALFAVVCVIIGVNISYFPTLFSYVFEVIKPIIYGFAITFLLHPLVKFTENRILRNKKEKKAGFRHFLSVIIVYVTVIAIVVLFAVAVIPEIIANYDTFRLSLLDYINAFQNKTAEFIGETSGEYVYVYYDIVPDLRKNITDNVFALTLRDSNGFVLSANSSSVKQDVRELFDSILSALGKAVTDSLPGFISSAMTVITEAKNFIIGLFLSLYFLLGENKHIARIKHILKAWLPEKTYTKVAWLTNKAKNIFRDYIIVRILDGIIIGVLVFVCLAVFQTPLTVLLALLMGICSLFPFIGPLFGISAGFIIMLIIDFRYAFVFLIITVLLNIIDSNYIEPFLNAGRSRDKLAAIWVFFAIVVMGGLFGLVGILLGIPVFAFIYAVFREFCEKRLREKSLPVRTEDYFIVKSKPNENKKVVTTEDGQQEITDMTVYFTEKKDEVEVYNEMRKKLSRKSAFFKKIFGKIKAFFVGLRDKIKGLFKKKK